VESGLRPATTQLENRLRRFGLRLLSLPQGSQAKENHGCCIGHWATAGVCLLGNWGRMESTILLDEPETTRCRPATQGGRERFRARPHLFHGQTTLRQWSRWAFCCMAERMTLGGCQNPHGLCITREPMMRTALPPPGPWKQLQDGTQLRRGAQSSRMPRLPSSGWPQRNLVPAPDECDPSQTSAGVEWLQYADRYGRRANAAPQIPLHASKRGIRKPRRGRILGLTRGEAVNTARQQKTLRGNRT